MKSQSFPRFERSTGAFTLIELLVVIAIIAILAGLLIQTAGFVQEKSGNARADAEMKAIAAALETYKLENGSYPEQASPNDTSTKVLIEELALNPINTPDQYNHRKPFEFPIKMLSAYKPSNPQPYDTVLGASSSLVDPFGNPYHYQFPGDANRSGEYSYDLFSKGKRNQGADNSTSPSDTNKWIKNW